jgi:hypothetical protein
MAGLPEGKIKQNKGSFGIDRMDWDALDRKLKSHLYKLWNRLSSGSYFPEPVREVAIKKKSGGIRKLGIPTLLDRIGQEVVKTHLERIVGSCPKRRNKLRCHLPMTGYGSKSSRRFIIFLFRPLLFSLNHLQMN